jgi:L-methionine (R)-S-oxide reductase
VRDVRDFKDHIACSATTLSEIVVPVLSTQGETMAVLDIDSDDTDAFDETDRVNLEKLCTQLGEMFS